MKSFKTALKKYLNDDVNQNDSREESFTSGWNAALKWAAQYARTEFTCDTGTIVDTHSILIGKQNHYYDPK